MIIVQLPYPPSTNRMWRNHRGRQVLSAEGRAYQGKTLAGSRKPPARRSVEHDVALIVTLRSAHESGWHRERCRA